MKRSYLWYAVIGIAVVAAIILLSDKGVPGISDNSPTATPTASPKAGATVKPGAKASATPNSMTYTQAVAKYSTTRIQFDQYCQASPSNVSWKNGTTIMLDNRSGDARKITVDGKAYNLAGYGFQIVTLTSTSLPKTISINCGSAVNVGKILLQASIGESL